MRRAGRLMRVGRLARVVRVFRVTCGFEIGGKNVVFYGDGFARHGGVVVVGRERWEDDITGDVTEDDVTSDVDDVRQPGAGPRVTTARL